jgi:hypothetical protein
MCVCGLSCCPFGHDIDTACVIIIISMIEQRAAICQLPLPLPMALALGFGPGPGHIIVSHSPSPAGFSFSRFIRQHGRFGG